jgi:RHH-type proline utilization regulon transcriptional repressor/proline dehydrogenase/delta 1-pyrroline-5-carboxylate dehydrogenase
MNRNRGIDKSRELMRAGMLADETILVKALVDTAELDEVARSEISAVAADLVRDVRGSGSTGIMEAFLSEYGLSTEEGVALMCLAEAMLRVPDGPTIDTLIALGTRAPNNVETKPDSDFCCFILYSANVALVPGRAFGAIGQFRASYANSQSELVEACNRNSATTEQLSIT